MYIPPDDGDDGSSSGEQDTRRFYPSTLAIVLTQPDLQHAGAGAGAGASSAGGSLEAEGPVGAALAAASRSFGWLQRGGDLHVIVEKNFKVYAYTAVDLHLALLALFAKIEQRLPNVVVATLTRRSVMSALEKGVSAAQIRRFLAARVHPSVTGAGLEVPENVVDQLFLWERERSRVTYKSGVLVTGFDADDAAVFRVVLDHVHAANSLVYADEASLCMVVLERAVARVHALVRDLKSSGGGGGGAAIG